MRMPLFKASRNIVMRTPLFRVNTNIPCDSTDPLSLGNRIFGMNEGGHVL
jgi:hypothetical protein